MPTPALQILTADAPDAIRAALDLSIDSNTIPDTVIYSMPYGPAAEAEVLDREAQVFPTPIDPVKQAAHREQAAIFLTAARLAHALPMLMEQTLGDSSYRRNPIDTKRRNAELRTLAEIELAAYLSPTGHVPVFRNFWLGKGRRGQ
jgi:hypothetical protein